MLDRMGMKDYSKKLQQGIFKTFEEGKFLTRDVGGKSGTNEFVKSVIGNLGD